VVMPRAFKIIRENQVISSPYFTFSTLDIETDGIKKNFPLLRRIPAVLVIPLSPSGRTVMVRQHRYGTNQSYWEFAGGAIDEGEQPADAALRELMEESGIAASNARLIGECHTSPGSLDQSYKVFVVDVSDDDLDRCRFPAHEDEIIEGRVFSLEDIRAMIDRHEMLSGYILGALMYLERDLVQQHRHRASHAT
jgi:ADP-ribose pyrophosphatase